MLIQFKIALIVLTITTFSIACMTFDPVSAIKKMDSEVNGENNNNQDQLAVITNINLENIEKKGFLKVVAFINGEDFSKKIPLDKLKESTKKVKVKFEMDKENELVSATKPDEFFVCAYHVQSPNIKSDSSVKQNSIEYFDCNEGDIQSVTEPTEVNLFKTKSQVYSKSVNYHNFYAKPKVVSFVNLDNNTKTTGDNTTSSNNLKIKSNNDNDNNNNKPVKVKIVVPLDDRKDIKKLKVMAMLKGQIKYEIIEDVQKEFDKIGGYTIERIFAFDKNTDIGPIQIGDRFHGCASGEGLKPNEGTECEKRLIKDFDKVHTLPVHAKISPKP
ncbi:MAG TPA: hypothetical protein VF222_10505 [Nitrososphaeraceae archaeon]